MEETGIEGSEPRLFDVKGRHERDPRKHVISIFYLVDVDDESVPEAGDDASEADWVDLAILEAEEVAGDHFDVIEQLRK